MARVPRELFVPEELRAARLRRQPAAAAARPDRLAAVHGRAHLPVPRGSRPGERVLDVGTGSGYAAAVLAELAGEVHSIERIPELAERPARRSAAAGLRARRRARRRRLARAAGARAVRGDRGRRRGDRTSRRRSGGSSCDGGRIVLPLRVARREQRLCVLERTAGRAARARVRAGAVRPARDRLDRVRAARAGESPC